MFLNFTNYIETNDLASVAVSHIAGQPINSTEQEVIGLLLAQQQVFTTSGKIEPSSVFANQSSMSSTVAMVPSDVLQSHGTEEKAIVVVSSSTPLIIIIILIINSSSYSHD